MERAHKPVALHVAPHPDDELIGAPAALMALRDAGWRVVNLACGLGRVGDEDRREAELREACRQAGFELRLPAGVRRADRNGLGSLVGEALAELRPAIVVSPSPHEPHPTHAKVAAAVRETLAELDPGEARWWMWGFWGSLRQPTLGLGLDRDRLDEVLDALAAHESQMARADYRRAVEGRAAMQAVLGAELIFGFGSRAGDGAPYAELLTEAIWTGDGWRLGLRRWLDPALPLTPAGEEEAVVE